MASQSNQQRGEKTKPMSDNERLSMEQRVLQVLAAITSRRAELEAVLPPDIAFDRFHATINQALRTNPEILACTGASIVNACVKSAYDGLRIDSREAALVAHNVNVGTRAEPRWESHAEYFPMVRGLIKKILMSREVIAVEVETIHEHDKYRIVRGTNPEILHEPLVVGPRGKIVAAYSVATLKSGHNVAEVMLRADLDAVRAEAKTKFVWDKWEGEMCKKSVLRRHEKRLPSGRDMIDIEAREMFPQFQPREALPQLSAPTARPTRDQFQQLGNWGGEAGTAMDFGVDRGVPEPAEHNRTERREAGNARRSDASATNQSNGQSNGTGDAAVPGHLPASPHEWSLWSGDVLSKIEGCTTIEAVNALRNEHAAAIDAAPDALRHDVSAAISDRIADLVAEAAD